MRNAAFERALGALAHPVSLGAILVLLINDHVLRRRWPSWWTGQLGDVAWLVFAPLMLAAVLAWLIPPRLRRQEAIVGLLAFTLTGWGFALAKTLPAFHALTVRALETALGGTVGLRRDPTDLIALPALLIGAYLWTHPARLPALQSKGWVALSLAALATVANQALTSVYGINYLQEQENDVLAIACNSSSVGVYFASQDGGLSWQLKPAQAERSLYCDGRHGVAELASDGGRVRYRFRPGESIERSDDGGQTWRREMTLQGNQARTVYLEGQIENAAYRPHFEPGPLDALVHSLTGNVILAMGLEGVLVRTPDAQWRWVSAGSFQPATMDRPGTVASFMQKEIWLALTLIGLTIGALAACIRRTRWGILWLCVGWGIWGVTVLTSPALSYRPGVYEDISRPAIDALLIGATLAAALLGWKGGRLFYAELPRALPRAILTAVLSTLLFILPYVLWSQGVLAGYTTAQLVGVVVVLVTLLAGVRWVRHLLRNASRVEDSSP